MLDIRERQRLDMQRLWISQQAIDVNAYGVRGQLGIESRT